MIGREAQLEELERVAGLGEPPTAETPVPLVVVYGGASAGKSAGVGLALRRRASSFALVDCATVFSAADLYREALAQLYAHAAATSNGNDEEDEEEEVVTVTDSDGNYGSLNFLSFVKALGVFINSTDKANRSRSRPRVLHLALDHVDKLLDRGLGALLPCVFAINDQLGYLHMFEAAPPWQTCVLLLTRGLSLEFDRLVAPCFPAYVNFPPYSPDQIAAILVEQLALQHAARAFRRWTMHLYGLLPPSPQGDWLEFRATLVTLLPDFLEQIEALEAVLDPAPSTPAAASSSPRTPRSPLANNKTRKLSRDTANRVEALLKSRRRHLFGFDAQASGSSDLHATTTLSQRCLLLVVAGYLASFNPQDTDVKFLSSAGGPRRKKRRSKKDENGGASTTVANSGAAPANQRLIGPRIFTLQRLLAIYLNLRVEAEAGVADDETGEGIVDQPETREDIFTHLATLVRMQLFQRTSPPAVLDNIKFRCLADWRFVQETASRLRFPIESYLYTGT